jgi:hypothetical protein
MPGSQVDDAAAMIATLQERFGPKVRADEPLARHGTFGVGGPARTTSLRW